MLRRQRLIRKRHVHHARRVTLRSRQIDEPAVRQHEEPLAVEPPFVHELADAGGPPLGGLLQPVEIDLDVEVTRVREHRAVFHCAHVLDPDHADVAGERHEHVAHPRRLGHRRHPVPVHLRLERLERIDLGDQHVRPGAARPQREAAPAPPIPRHHHCAPRDQQVGGAQDAVERRLPGAVAIVEQVLGVGVVHGDHGELQHPVPRHRLEADHARRGLLRRAGHARDERLALRRRQRLHPPAHGGRQIVEPVQGDHVQRADQIRAVVHRHVGPVRQRRADVLVIGRVVLALDREHLDPVILHEVGRDVVLRRERVGGAQRHVGSAGLEGDGEVRRLRGNVQASR